MSEQQHLANNIIDIYKKYAHAWTALRGEHLYEKSWLDTFLALLAQQATILDLGCGSGKPIAKYLIQHGHTLTGIDSSEVMIELAEQNFPNQTWLIADMRSVQLNQTYLGILAWDSFFHLTPDDQRQMFHQFSKFATQGTVLMFSSGPAEGIAIGDMFGEALYHASLSQQEYRDLLAENGFDVLKMVAENAECTGHTVKKKKKL